MKQTITFFVALICQLEKRAQARHQELLATILVNGGMSPSKSLEHAAKSTQMIVEKYPIDNLAKRFLDE